MTFKSSLVFGVAIFVALSFVGCKEKTADACSDPSCEDPSCVVDGKSTIVNTKRELDPQSICPVMGASIDKSLFVEKDSLRIYMSEESCREEVVKNFDKYVDDLKGMGQKPEAL